MVKPRRKDGSILVQVLVVVMLMFIIVTMALKLTFIGRFSEARTVERATARAVLDSARNEVFACLQNAGPYPSPAGNCVLNENQKSCLPRKAQGQDLTISLSAKNGRCLLRLSITNNL